MKKLLGKKSKAVNQPVSDYLTTVEYDARPGTAIFWGLLFTVVGFGGFLFWATTAPLDQGVVSMGTLNVDSKRKTIQHLRGGIVEQILVNDGDKVKKDQALIKLNVTQLEKTKLSMLEQMKGLEQQVAGKSEQIRLLNDEHASLKKLFDEGYLPRNRLFDLERGLAELTGSRGENMSNIAAIKERLAATDDDIQRSIIRSPTEGIVMGLNVHTIGGVVNPSEKLMDIVPENEDLVVDTQVPTHVIDKVRVGLLVDLRFTALNQTITPIVSGEVITVSADSFADQRTGATFYTAKVSVPQASLKKLGNQKLQPGMPVDVIIKTGERTMMEYLLKPLTDRMARSLKEE